MPAAGAVDGERRVAGAQLRDAVGLGYLLRHTREGRAHDDDERTRDHDEDTPRDRRRDYGARSYYTAGTEHSEPAGTWWGRGADCLGLRGEITEDVMETLYGGLIHPVTGKCSAPRRDTVPPTHGWA